MSHKAFSSMDQMEKMQFMNRISETETVSQTINGRQSVKMVDVVKENAIKVLFKDGNERKLTLISLDDKTLSGLTKEQKITIEYKNIFDIQGRKGGEVDGANLDKVSNVFKLIAIELGITLAFALVGG